MIIRYIRVRPGDLSANDYDAVSGRYFKHAIIDLVSASWSIDECMSIYHCDSITVQWSMIAESLSGSNHVKGSHGFGSIWVSNYGTYHPAMRKVHRSLHHRYRSVNGMEPLVMTALQMPCSTGSYPPHIR
nr:hypothetical protein [Echinicola rosea]